MSEDPAVSPSVDAEFVTVAEAARALGCSERTARRYAARLGAGHVRSVRVDRGQSARRVSLAAMRALREENSEQEAPEDKPDTDKAGHGRTGPRVAARDREDLVDLRERLARAEARAELLERERNDWQEQARATLAELRASREQQAVLLAAATTGRLSSAAPEEPLDAATASHDGRTEIPASTMGDGHDSVKNASPQKPIGFWGRLLGKR